jgi:hypothetical protein
MQKLLEKLNFRDQRRIAVINAEDDFKNSITVFLSGVIVDYEIDPRCPYNFMIIFAKKVSEVESLAPVALHNLTADGILWFCYPKKTSRSYMSDLERDKGWKTLNDSGFFGVRMVSVDDNWSAMRFRNIKFIRSSSGRFPK